MRILLFTLTIALWITGNFTAIAQETEAGNALEIQEQTTDLNADKQLIIENEKELLRKEVANINSMLENSQVTSAEAEALKVKAAEKTALNIENKVAIIDNRIALLERNGEEDGGFTVRLSMGKNRSDNSVNSPSKFKRTHSSLTFAFGLNNAIIEGQSLDDSPYKVGGSRFAELGYAWTTRVFDDSNWLRVKYGFSFQFNGLKFEDNNYLVDNGDGTNNVEEFPENLDKAKFRMDNLVIPIHFEFGPSNVSETNGKKHFSTYEKFKFGLGGYAGINLNTIQKLKYEIDGDKVKEKLGGSYNTNNFVYGLSGYIGWDTMSLYVKYDLNPIFNNGPEQRNVSAGLRFDLD